MEAADATLIARMRVGDPQAWREVVLKHQPSLLSVARTILRNEASAAEVVQETWLSVVANLDRFEGRSRLSTWVFEIMLNKARTRASRDGRWVAFADLATGSGEEADEGDPTRFLQDGHWAEPVPSWEHLDPERIVAGRELWSHVVRALDALPAAQRTVVIMRDVDGLELDEVSALLGLTRGHVRVLLHRGRGRLRRTVEALGQEGASPSHASVTRPGLAQRNAGAARPSETAHGSPPAVSGGASGSRCEGDLP